MPNLWSCVVGAVAIAGCGDNAVSLERPSVPVVDREEPASIAECAYGGSIVSSGLDDNRNGALDDPEIEKRTVVCNDAPAEPPPPLVFRLVPESAGLMCDRDGTAVQSGHDRNRNGRLDDDEVDHIEYACGERMLTRLVAEPAGARCTAGGVATLIGRDRDHDGVLADGEIEVTDIQCGSELSGDVALHGAEDVAALASITLIAGSLTVTETALTELALPRLVQVRGGLEVKSNAQLTRISMPALQTVDARFTLALNQQLTAIDLPVLHRIEGLVVVGNRALADLTGLSGLTDVIHDILISGNDSMTSADLSVEHVGGNVTMGGNARLAQVAYTATGTGAILIASNPVLEMVDIEPANFDTPGQITISSNAQLNVVLIGGFDLGGLRIENNPWLSSVQLGAAEIHGDLVLRANGPLHLALSGGDSLFDLSIAGSLMLAGPILTFSLSSSLHVTGDCTIEATVLSSLGASNRGLDIGRRLSLTDNANLVTVGPVLVGGGLEVRNNAALANLGFLFQDQIDGDLTVVDNAALAAAPSLEALRRVRGNVRIASNPALKAAFGRALAQVDGSLGFDGNDKLDDLGLGHLVHAGSLSVAHSAALSALELPALADVASVEVRGNSGLQHVAMPVLRSADLGVFDNLHLPACEVEAVFAAILGEHHQSGNDETAVCP